jgi:succinate-semialdehyde dehydrogenase/glutarate-semialdehyde dehydrogenase
LGQLAKRAGVPDGVINVITTHEHVKEVGQELCESPAVRKISFTGSTNVAKLLYRLSSSTLKKWVSTQPRRLISHSGQPRLSLEAGGNAPFIVFNDADINAAVEGAIASKFRNSGQTCICANRLYVQSGVYAEFASRLADKVSQFKVGNGLEEST